MVQMSFKALAAFCSAGQNHLCNFWILFGGEKNICVILVEGIMGNIHYM